MHWFAGLSLSFNGATAFRQWKRVCTAATAIAATTASMGPPPSGSGNFSVSPCRKINSASFNGATAFRQWKLRGSLLRSSPARTASMGPPPFGSGNHTTSAGLSCDTQTLQWGHRLSAVETTFFPSIPVIASSSFNGATAFRQWKHCLDTCGAGYPSKLQWGHRHSAVETRAS